jgi:hypothetical protein
MIPFGETVAVLARAIHFGADDAQWRAIVTPKPH